MWYVIMSLMVWGVIFVSGYWNLEVPSWGTIGDSGLIVGGCRNRCRKGVVPITK